MSIDMGRRIVALTGSKIYFSEFQIFVKAKVGHRAKTRKNPKLFWGRTKFGRSSLNSVFLGYPLSLHRLGQNILLGISNILQNESWAWGQNENEPETVLRVDQIWPKYRILVTQNKPFWGQTKFGRSSPNSVCLGYPFSLHCTMRRSLLQSVNRTMYQNVYLTPHFFPPPLFQMTNIWRKYLITFTFIVYLTTWVMNNHSHNKIQ